MHLLQDPVYMIVCIKHHISKDTQPIFSFTFNHQLRFIVSRPFHTMQNKFLARTTTFNWSFMSQHAI